MSLPLVVLGREPGVCLLLTFPLPAPTSDLLDGPLTSQIQKLRRSFQGKELKNGPMCGGPTCGGPTCGLDKEGDKAATALTQASPPAH